MCPAWPARTTVTARPRPSAGTGQRGTRIIRRPTINCYLEPIESGPKITRKNRTRASEPGGAAGLPLGAEAADEHITALLVIGRRTGGRQVLSAGVGGAWHRLLGLRAVAEVVPRTPSSGSSFVSAAAGDGAGRLREATRASES